jgi:excinuclease UvrABC nuclease subunit
MTNIINKSEEILLWTEENIKKAPEGVGIYTLRDSTTVDSIIYIGIADKQQLRQKLLDHFKTEDIDGVKFFDWYQTDTFENASTLHQSWISKYHPKFNT